MNFSILIATTLFLSLLFGNFSALPMKESKTGNSTTGIDNSLLIGLDQTKSMEYYGNYTNEKGLCIICTATKSRHTPNGCFENQVLRRGTCRTIQL